jgi:hypothetical protein
MAKQLSLKSISRDGDEEVFKPRAVDTESDEAPTRIDQFS